MKALLLSLSRPKIYVTFSMEHWRHSECRSSHLTAGQAAGISELETNMKAMLQILERHTSINLGDLPWIMETPCNIHLSLKSFRHVPKICMVYRHTCRRWCHLCWSMKIHDLYLTSVPTQILASRIAHKRSESQFSLSGWSSTLKVARPHSPSGSILRPNSLPGHKRLPRMPEGGFPKWWSIVAKTQFSSRQSVSNSWKLRFAGFFTKKFPGFRRCFISPLRSMQCSQGYGESPLKDFILHLCCSLALPPPGYSTRWAWMRAWIKNKVIACDCEILWVPRCT